MNIEKLAAIKCPIGCDEGEVVIGKPLEYDDKPVSEQLGTLVRSAREILASLSTDFVEANMFRVHVAQAMFESSDNPEEALAAVLYEHEQSE